MKYTNEAKLINELITISQVVYQNQQNDKFSESFGFDEENISFLGLINISKYKLSIEKLYTSNKSICETFSFFKFQDRIIELIRTLKVEKTQCKAENLNEIIDDIIRIEIIEHEIFYPFYGAQMNSDLLKFGDFTIYDKQKCKELLNEKSFTINDKDLYFELIKSDLLISIKIKARESDKAFEIADKYCMSFENVFSYVLGDLSNDKRIGIFNFRGFSTMGKIISSNLGIGFNGKSDVILGLNLDHNYLSYFNNKELGNDEVWFLITKKDKSEIEKRLLNAIEWVGKAINDRDNSKSLIQFVFAIEGMLQYDEKIFINQSIVSQLADSLAFIITDEKEERKKMSRKFKDIYKKRSSIAHGSNAKIDFEDLEEVFEITKNMIISFLIKSPFKEMKTMESLNTHIINLKFN